MEASVQPSRNNPPSVLGTILFGTLEGIGKSPFEVVYSRVPIASHCGYAYPSGDSILAIREPFKFFTVQNGFPSRVYCRRHLYLNHLCDFGS